MKKGITLIALSTTIVVMIIILTTVTISSTNAINNSKKVKFATELLSLEQAVEDYKLLHQGQLPKKSTQITSANLPEGIYYEIDMSVLGLIDTTYGKKLNSDNNDIYVLSSTGKVYYLKGLKIASNTYYTLDEELKNTINYSNRNTSTKDGIVFTSSNTEYTNSEITVEVQIPIEYSDVSVFSQGDLLSNFETTEEYYIYTVTKTSNFDVTVSYTKEGASLKQVHTVSNFDNEAPTINVVDTSKVDIDNEVKTNITISTNDDLSGVKKVLYETTQVDKSYFESENKGKNLDNNTITVDKFVENITFYAIDNAGNSKILVKNLTRNATTDDYVKYGLLSYYDGIKNSDAGTSTTTTIWKDLSGNGNNGELKNFNNTTSSGWNNGYLVFDGTDDVVRLGLANYDFSKGITLSMILRFDDSISQEFFGNWEGAGGGLAIYSTKKIMCCFYIGEEYISVTDTEVIEVNRDYNIYVTYDGNNLKLYVDGVLKATTPYVGSIKTSPVPIAIGANPAETKNYNYSKISVKKAMVYNRGLTEDEIKQNYTVDEIRY